MHLQTWLSGEPDSSALKIFTGLGLMAVIACSSPALAQQASECLECHTGLPATEFNLIGEETVESPVTTPADTVIDTANCDYTNADQYGGWGWNPVLRESCAPGGEDPHARFPICSAQYFDSDVDGFGFENNASCIVTSASAGPPVITNQQTGTQVSLTRAYWDGNTDIANRTIQCDLYYYDNYPRVYVKERKRLVGSSSLSTYPSHQFRHLSIPSSRPFDGWIAEVYKLEGSSKSGDTFNNKPIWTVDDGRYIGPTMLQSPYVEIVTRPNGYKGIRHWVKRNEQTALSLSFSGNQVRRDGFYECWDTSGRDFVPTGRSGTPTSSPVTVSDLVVSARGGSGQQTPESIINLETNQPVVLEKAYWNYNKDLALKTASCSAYDFFTDPYDGSRFYMDLALSADYSFPYHFTNSGSRLYYWDNTFGDSNPSFNVSNDELVTSEFGTIFTSTYVEKISGGVRFWTSSREFTECLGISPTGAAPTILGNGQCDYTNADQYGGWGWNSVTRESCAPATAPVATQPVESTPADSNCDYSNAAAFGGWGWNSVTRESCAPVSSSPPAEVTAPVDSDCDYSNAAAHGGWGWNSVTATSCAPSDSSPATTDQNCDYSNASSNGGWGWNSVTRMSCAP